ncbi:MAG: hypothetical protein QOI57_3340 [Rubrobacteraceae bacterium]|jgi:hypothetical protein|nr:hypothetical protein [Rubrobacteraceae bacterium]
MRRMLSVLVVAALMAVVMGGTALSASAQGGDTKPVTIRVTGTPGVPFLGAYCANSCGSLEGVTSQDFVVEGRTGDLVTANVQKQDEGNQELRLQVMVDGQVVQEQSTTEQFGMVMVTVDAI